jgi:hypothetical protein
MEKIILSKEEITELKQSQDLQNELMRSLGEIEYQIQELELQKEEFRNKMKGFKTNNQKMGENLQSKYGDGVVNLDSGEFNKS